MNILSGSAIRLLAVSALGFCAPLAQAETAPAFPIEKVLAIANKVLAERNEPDVFIRSIVLTKPAMFSDKQKWEVTWSRALPASKPQLREVGLSVTMEGKAARLVK